MIIPAPADLRSFSRFPLTWTLLALNAVIFVMIFNGRPDNAYQTQKLLQADGMQITGRLYYQYLENLAVEELLSRPAWVRDVKANNPDQMEVLGAYALRDRSFLDVAEKMDYRGDSVRIAAWKVELAEFKDYYFNQSVFWFGLHSFGSTSSLGWITYQFSHSGWLHLLSNMVFLVLLGAAVEAVAGSLAVVVIYLFGGFAGGLLFLLLNAHGAVPMVGASASVSALLAFYCVVEPRKRIRFFYFVTPFAGQNGFIYLPTLLIFPLFLLVDFASLMGTPDGLGSGVAYSAHIGGTLFGFLAGAIFLIFSRGSLKSQTLSRR